jgi:hypothetical protein
MPYKKGGTESTVLLRHHLLSVDVKLHENHYNHHFLIYFVCYYFRLLLSRAVNSAAFQIESEYSITSMKRNDRAIYDGLPKVSKAREAVIRGVLESFTDVSGSSTQDLKDKLVGLFYSQFRDDPEALEAAVISYSPPPLLAARPGHRKEKRKRTDAESDVSDATGEQSVTSDELRDKGHHRRSGEDRSYQNHHSPDHYHDTHHRWNKDARHRDSFYSHHPHQKHKKHRRHKRHHKSVKTASGGGG